MLKYMGNVTLALALQCFVIYQVLLFVFTRLNPIKFVKKIPSGYGICIFHRNLQRNNPDVD